MESVEPAYEIWAAGCERQDAGDHAGAIALFRQALRLGNRSARLNLANLLTQEDREQWAEGMKLYYRGVRDGCEASAWNLAMEHRIRGNRRRYFHWLRVAARMGEPQAQATLRVVDDIRRRGGRAPMLFLDAIDEYYVQLVLRDFLDRDRSSEQVAVWAGLVARGEAALGPPQSRRVADAIRELADEGRKLTRKRARELIFKMD